MSRLDKNGEYAGYSELPTILGGSSEGLSEIKRALVFFNQPCPRHIITAELNRLDLTMAKRTDTLIDFKGRLAAYVTDLQEFPEDVIMTVFERYRKENRWFPAIADLFQLCTDAAWFRRAMLAEIDRAERANVFKPAQAEIEDKNSYDDFLKQAKQLNIENADQLSICELIKTIKDKIAVTAP